MSVTKLEVLCNGLQILCVDLVLTMLTVPLHWLSLPGNVKRERNKQKGKNGLR